MEIFFANRLSNGNLLFPSEIRIDEHFVTIVKPGLISSREKSIEIKKITSVDIVSPLIGFSKIIISAYSLDTVVTEGFERIDIEIVRDLILKYKRG